MHASSLRSSMQQLTIQFIKPIGQGGFGRVYLAEVARENGLRQRVAVKQIHPEYTGDQQLMGRQRDEARLMGSLRHDRIVQVYDFVEYQGRMLIMMEYVQGPSLSQIVKQHPMHTDFVAQMLSDCADALAYAWSAPHPDTGRPLHVIHRDIKPSNIVLSHTGHFKLLDFGIARAEMTRDIATGSYQVGTERYMAPEQWLHNAVSSAVDVFALGLTAVELLTGQLWPRLPLDSTYFHDELCKRFAAIPDEGHILSDALKELLWSMLQFDPRRRPSIEEVQSRAEGIADGFSGHPARQFLQAYSATSEVQPADDDVSLIPDASVSPEVVSVQLETPIKNWLSPLVLGLLFAGTVLIWRTIVPVTNIEEIDAVDSTSSIEIDETVTLSREVVSLDESPPDAARIEPAPVGSDTPVVASTPLKKTQPKPIMHDVTISSIPMGAMVWLDGQPLGRTLLTAVSISEGSHQLRLEFEDASIHQVIDVTAAHRYVWQVNAEAETQWSSF